MKGWSSRSLQKRSRQSRSTKAGACGISLLTLGPLSQRLFQQILHADYCQSEAFVPFVIKNVQWKS